MSNDIIGFLVIMYNIIPLYLHAASFPTSLKDR